MSSFVLELQQYLLTTDCDTLIALRKAHIISAKLKLTEFDSWLQNELNGYQRADNVPSYRIVHGSGVAKNPFYGFIPVSFANPEIEQLCTQRNIYDSIASLIELCKSNEGGSIYLRYPGKIEQLILNGAGVDLPIFLQINIYHIKNIIESVRNCLIEWSLKLESEGIVGENMVFQDSEKVTAQNIPQQVHNYYGTVVNGNVEHSQVISGQNHTIEYNEAQKALADVKESIEKEDLCTEDKETALALLEDISDKISQKKKPSVIKAVAKALGESLMNAGASVAAEIVMARIEGRL